MRSAFIAILLVVISVSSFQALNRADAERSLLPQPELAGYIIPSRILKVISLEFDGLVSDLLTLKAAIFLGNVPESSTTAWIKEAEWRWLYSMFDIATDLDPYFMDPYYFANAYFTGKAAGMVRETNTLLDKGMRARSWDWVLPFFSGFNHFYYLQDNEKAAEYLIEASRRPGASPAYASVASTLAFRERKTEQAIAFLEEIYRTTPDGGLKRQYEARLTFLYSVLKVEQAVAAYKQKYRKGSTDIDELMRKGFLKEYPYDPYGGKFTIGPDGQVNTTNQFSMVR